MKKLLGLLAAACLVYIAIEALLFVAAVGGWLRFAVAIVLAIVGWVLILRMVLAARCGVTTAVCESCGARAEVKLRDGSTWCISCDLAARHFGYDNQRARLLR